MKTLIHIGDDHAKKEIRSLVIADIPRDANVARFLYDVV